MPRSTNSPLLTSLWIYTSSPFTSFQYLNVPRVITTLQDQRDSVQKHRSILLLTRRGQDRGCRHFILWPGTSASDPGRCLEVAQEITHRVLCSSQAIIVLFCITPNLNFYKHVKAIEERGYLQHFSI